MRKYEKVLDGLWQDYVTLNPHAKKVHDLLASKGEAPANDHIAFRTFDMGRIGLPVLAAKFEELGWRKGGDYDIKEKRVTAIHLDPPFWHLPKVFISELRTAEFSPDFQAILFDLTRRVPRGLLERPDFLWSGAPWGQIPSLRYERLRRESEYAAWVAAFGYRANHFTVSVNNLKFTQDLAEVNRLLLENGHRLNGSGGLIKGSPEQLLEQSSTMAEPVTVKFSDRTAQIPACYYEFAKRYPLPSGWLFQGFIETSATRIFDSTTAQPPARPVTNGSHGPAKAASFGALMDSVVRHSN